MARDKAADLKAWWDLVNNGIPGLKIPVAETRNWIHFPSEQRATRPAIVREEHLAQEQRQSTATSGIRRKGSSSPP